MQLPETLDGWLGLLEARHGQAIQLGLDRVRTVRDALNLRQTCPVFIIGGTNGKGSTCALLEAVLLAAGKRVGLYTSPHLLRYNERVRIDGRDADDAALIAAFERIEAARLGQGVAIPHGTNDARRFISKASLGFLQFPEGVDWDGETVHVVLPIASNSDEHVSILSALATTLSDKSNSERLRTATSVDEVLEPGARAAVVDEHAVALRGILIHDESDEPALREHIEHLPHAFLVGDVHADERAVLVDEAVGARRFLLHRDADERDAGLRESAAHELPVAAVCRRDDAALAERETALELVEALDAHVIADVLADDWEAQDLHEHRAEADTAGLREALGLLLVDAEAHHDLVLRELLAPLRHERPGQGPEGPADDLTGAARQQAADLAQRLQQIV